MIMRQLKIWFWGEPSIQVAGRYQFSVRLNRIGLRFFAKLILRRIALRFGVYVGVDTIIGEGVYFPHPTGVVIGNGAIIGKNCTIYQNVTIGAARIGDAQKNLYPRIGSNVVLFAGAKILGEITIGDNAIVGANAVVTKDVPPNCVAIGVPARNTRKI